MLSPENQERLDTIRREVLPSSIFPVRDSGSSTCPVCGYRGKFFSKSGWSRCYRTQCELTIHNKGAAYDVVGLYMYREGLSGGADFYRALDLMEAEFNLGSTSRSIENPRSSLLSRVVEVYASELNSSRGSKARDYLTGRGVSQELIDMLGLGYSPHDSILREYGLEEKELEREGLLTFGREPFSNRIIFPIRSTIGNLVHLTGRYLGATPSNSRGESLYPKWKHSSGGPSSISNYLVLEDLIRAWNSSTLILAEGFIDTVSLYQLGIPALGTLGLQGITKHLPKLKSSKELIAMYDVDTFEADHPLYPGEYKSWRIVLPQLVDLQLLLPELEINLVFVPREFRSPSTGSLYYSKDVNEWVSKGLDRKTVLSYIDTNKISLVDYMISKYGVDLHHHSSLLKLCVATGRGHESLAKFIPSGYDCLTYAMAVI